MEILAPGLALKGSRSALSTGVVMNPMWLLNTENVGNRNGDVPSVKYTLDSDNLVHKRNVKYCMNNVSY